MRSGDSAGSHTRSTRFQEGHYVLAHFSLDAAHLRELERTLTASEDMLRHLITKVDKRSKPAPAPEAQAAQAPQETPSSDGRG